MVDKPKVAQSTQFDSNALYRHASAINRLSDDDFFASLLYDRLIGSGVTISIDAETNKVTLLASGGAGGTGGLLDGGDWVDGGLLDGGGWA